eukprot:GEMP01007367.1.p1 GENE.GEMP01007367.1~~GEMP01007367.1.p1  ORF type:complete len:440 (-),score=116.00 GEMP01007367.1:2365-3624(-)
MSLLVESLGAWFGACCFISFVREKPVAGAKKKSPKKVAEAPSEPPLVPASIVVPREKNSIPRRDTIKHAPHQVWLKEEQQTPTQAKDRVELGQNEDANGKHMEDRVVTKIVGDIVFFGVYDGHGAGRMTDSSSRTCVDHVSQVVDDRLIPIVQSGLSGEELAANVRDSFEKIENEVLAEGTGYLNGTTACAGVIQGNKLVVVNLGDSQALLCRDGVLHELTSVHRPTNENERTRIEKEGARVILSHDGHAMEHRLESGLSVSRSFGDFGVDMMPSAYPSASDDDDEDSESTRDSIVKVQVSRASSCQGTSAVEKARGLSALPECHEVALEENDEFILIACDGVFDVMNTTMAMQIVRRTLRNPQKTADNAAAELLRQCKAVQNLQGSIDNLSAVVVLLKRPAPFVNRNSALRLRKKADD